MNHVGGMGGRGDGVGSGMTSYAKKSPWVAQQLETIDDNGGDTRAVQVQGRPVTVFTVTGAKSGLARRVPLMRVEKDGVYLLVASKGGAPEHPAWYASVTKNPQIEVHDGTEKWTATTREISGAEREEWWGARRRRLPLLRRVPGEDRPTHPDPARRTRLTPRSHPPTTAGCPTPARFGHPGVVGREEGPVRPGASRRSPW